MVTLMRSERCEEGGEAARSHVGSPWERSGSGRGARTESDLSTETIDYHGQRRLALADETEGREACCRQPEKAVLRLRPSNQVPRSLAPPGP